MPATELIVAVELPPFGEPEGGIRLASLPTCILQPTRRSS